MDKRLANLVCDTVVARNFLLAGAFDLLAQVARPPILLPDKIFNNDSEDTPQDLRSELRRGLDYHLRKLQELLPGTPEHDRETTLVQRFRSLYDLVAQESISIVELSIEEFALYGSLLDRDYCKDRGLPLNLHSGEAACLSVAVKRGWPLATDDSDGVKAAGILGVETYQTRRLLKEAISLGLIIWPRAKALHDEMRENCFHDAEWICQKSES